MDALDKKLMGFHQIAAEKLQNILAQISGKCDLIIEPDLIKPLELVVGAAWLRSKGIDKIYKFDPNQLSISSSSSHLLYFIRGHRLNTLSKVLDQVKGLRSRTTTQYSDSGAGTVHFHVAVLPNVECKHEKLLEEEGMHGVVKLYRFSWDFLTLDRNVLSLELPEVFKEVFVAKNLTVLPSIAKSLRILDMIAGKPSFVMTYGRRADKLWQMVQHLEHKRPSRNDENPNANEFSAVLIMDREKDYVSSFMTPVTYSGLLTEMYGSNAGHLITDQRNRIDQGKLEWLDGRGGGDDRKATGNAVKPQSPAAVSNLKMSSAIDKTFSDNKYRHFSEVLTTLSMQAKALGLEGQEYSRDMKIQEMKQFVEKKLPKVAAAKKELVKHLNLCEEIVDELGKHFEMIQRVEENMAFNQNRKQTLQEIEEIFLTLHMNKYVALKLLVLFHLTFGMTEDEMTTSIRNYFNAFGFEHLQLVVQLIEAGLLPNSVLTTSGNLSAGPSMLMHQQKLKSKILNTLPKLQSSFYTNANKLKQIPVEEAKNTAPEVGTARTGQPNCPSYVFNRNYIPTIAQLTNLLCTCQTFEELFLKIAHLEDLLISSKLNPENTEAMPLAVMNDLIKARRFPELLPFKPKSMMVFILGGITYAEVAACDLISKLTGCKVVVSSSSLISGYDLVLNLS